MSVIDTLDRPFAAPRRVWLGLAAAVLVSLAAMALLAVKSHMSAPTAAGDAANFFTVVPTTLDITLHPDGALSAVNNTDITCPVEGQNTIQTIVPEGSFVKKGQVICTLDPTEHERTLATDELEQEKSDNDVKWAREEKSIQDVKNDAELAAAISEKKLADIDLESYTKGEYPAELKETQKKLEMANITLKKKQELYATSKKLFDRGFIALSELQASELEVVTARNDQEKADSDLTVLTLYKSAKELTEKQDKVAQANNKVARTRDQNASNTAQKVADLNTKERQLALHKTAAEHSCKMFEDCTIKAPADGMVLYASSVAEYYRGDQPIGAGAKVMQEQLIIRLPDVSQMKAVVNVPEGKVSSLKVDPAHPVRATVAIVGQPAPIGATMTKVGVLPDMQQRWWNPDSKFYPVDLDLDSTPSGLKPGVSVKVTLSLDRLIDVLAVPVGAIFSRGDQQYVFVRDTPRPRPAAVKLGQANDTMAAVTEGVSAGDEVLLLQPGQGQDLLDAAGIKPPTTKPATNPATSPS